MERIRRTEGRRAEDTPADTVTISGPQELVASIPAVLGFVPGAGSVILVCGPDADVRMGPVVRVDHPDLSPVAGDGPVGVPCVGCGTSCTDCPPPVDASLPQFLAELCDREGVRRVWLLAVLPGCTEPGSDEALLARDVVESLDWWLASAGVEVADAFGVDTFGGGLPWVGFLGTCDGTQQDPGATQLAALHAVLGRRTFEDREQIDELYRQRDAGAVDVDPDAPDPPVDPSAIRAAIRVHRSAARGIENGSEPDDLTLAAVGSGLCQWRVRDEVLGELCARPLGADDGRRRLWWAIARRRPAAERSVALCLLGTAAYHEGNGAQARSALGEALRADPDNTLAGLTLRALDHGVRPSAIRAVGA